jgi:hypothetical protein
MFFVDVTQGRRYKWGKDFWKLTWILGSLPFSLRWFGESSNGRQSPCPLATTLYDLIPRDESRAQDAFPRRAYCLPRSESHGR